jgi:hypothetical protein
MIDLNNLAPQIATYAIESFVDTINKHGSCKAELIYNVIIDDVQYVQINYTMVKPIEFIKLDFDVDFKFS